MRRIVPLLLAVVVVVVALWRPWEASRRNGPVSDTIVLITADTLRRDHVSVYGARVQEGLTPRMDALAAQGVRFTNARTPVPLTLPGHTTMLAGLPPAATGVRLNAYGRIPAEEVRHFPLLPERLQQAGWKTGAFVSAAPLLALYGLEQGFDRYDDEGLDDEPPTPTYAERPGEDTVDRALAWIGVQGATAKVFLWVHLFEPHYPYAPHLPATTPPAVRYRADVVRCDEIVGRLLDGLARAGRADAVVLLTADHGEALGEHGEKTHGYLLGDAVLRVPFLLKAPGLEPSVRDDPVDLADVAPTLAGLAGVPWPDGDPDLPGRGRDLGADPSPGRVRVAESLFAQQRYGWAQLTAAVTEDGGMLVDAGGSRILWLEPAPAGEPQAGPGPAKGPKATTLGPVLRAYRDGERKDLIRSGGVAGGYGSAASASSLLEPAANGRLANPYDSIPSVYAIQREAQRLRHVSPKSVLARLARLQEADPTNPEIAFRIGQAWQELAGRGATEAERAEARSEARAAYLDAFRLGRKDANTLGRAVAVDAEGKEEEALALLRDLAPQVGEDGRLALLEARLLRALGRDDEADEACRRADRLCRRPWERADLDRARAEGVCR